MSEEKEAALAKNAQAPRNKQHEVEEATNILNATRKCFRHIVLDYVMQVRLLQNALMFLKDRFFPAISTGVKVWTTSFAHTVIWREAEQIKTFMIKYFYYIFFLFDLLCNLFSMYGTGHMESFDEAFASFF